SDALLRVGRENQGMPATAEEAEAAGLQALPKAPESTVLIRMARLEWRRAVYLASPIHNPTYRNEMLYRIPADQAGGSAPPHAAARAGGRGARGGGEGRAAGPLGRRAPPPPPPAPAPPGESMPRYVPGRRTMPGPVPVQPPNPLGTRPPANLAQEAVAPPPPP